MLTYKTMMDFDVQMKDSDGMKELELQRAIEHLDRKLARKLILDDNVKPTAIQPTHLLRFLHVAVESRDCSLVNELLKLKPNLNCPEGGQILWIVAEDGNTEIASMLVYAGADLNERMRGCNFLHVLISSASLKKHQLALLMIQHGADVNARDYKGYTALYYAVKRQSTHLVVELLRRNAIVGDFVISYAARKSKAADFLPILIESHRDDVETRDRQAVSAIMFLITQDNENRIAVIQALLDIGISVDLVNTCGWTSLVFAIIFKRVGVVELLLKYGADVNKKSANGVLPIFAASSLEDSIIAKMLIKKGANIHDHNDEDRQYPLHAACANESLSNIHLLLSLGADINVVDRSNRTPFSLMDTAETLNPCTKYVIKHFALIVSKDSIINDLDLSIIYESSHTQTLYEDCLEELEKMKRTKIYNDISFFCVFSKNIQELSLLIRNRDFVESYNMRPKKSLFPIYFSDMSIAFRNSEKRKNILVYKENTVNKITKGILPFIALRKIAYYLCLYDLESV